MTTASDEKTLVSAHFSEVGEETVPVLSVAPESHRVTRGTNTPGLLVTDRFLERELIGQGGMGSVIRAFDKDLQRDVAVKVVSPDASTGGANVERLMEEARITGRLEHPHIVPVYEFGTDDRGARFLCMKLVQGETLEETLSWAGSTRLDPDFLIDLLQIFVKVCDAVAFAHSRGVLHHDIKPSNVMIGDFGQVYLLDWGLARLKLPLASTNSDKPVRSPETDPFGLITGTPRYMAPEHLHGGQHQFDERTDVFALGATLYQILTGKPPHAGYTLRQIALVSSEVVIAAPETLVDEPVPAELSRIALKALSHDPADRYATVNDLKRDIEQFQRGTWYLPRKWFSAGSMIVTEGEPADSAFIVVEGQCVAFCDDHGTQVARRAMGPGDVFGETAIASRAPRTASVEAVTDVTVMVVTNEALSGKLGQNGWMGTFVLALADRFRELDERLAQLERRTRPTERPPPRGH